MKPQETRSLELGSKWDLLDQRLSLTAAWYRADNQNEVVVVDSATNQYGQFGKRRAEGLELGAVGLLTKHWQVIAGVASTRTEVLQGLATGSSGVGAASRFTPKLSATLWTVFEQGDWQLGGGARHMGEQRRVTDLSVADAAANMAEEAKDPFRTVPRAIVGSVVAAGVLGMVFAVALTIAIKDIPAATATDSPVALILRDQLGVVMERSLLVAIVIAFFGAGTVTLATCARMVFAMARAERFQRVADFHGFDPDCAGGRGDRAGIRMVGATGIEPVTPTVSR